MSSISGRRRPAFRASAAAAAAVAMSLASVSLQAQQSDTPSATESAITFNIPAQALARALNRFGDIAGLQIVYAASLAEGKQSAGIAGTLSVRDALARLLAGTGARFPVYRRTHRNHSRRQCQGSEGVGTRARGGRFAASDGRFQRQQRSDRDRGNGKLYDRRAHCRLQGAAEHEGHRPVGQRADGAEDAGSEHRQLQSGDGAAAGRDDGPEQQSNGAVLFARLPGYVGSGGRWGAAVCGLDGFTSTLRDADRHVAVRPCGAAARSRQLQHVRKPVRFGKPGSQAPARPRPGFARDGNRFLEQLSRGARCHAAARPRWCASRPCRDDLPGQGTSTTTSPTTTAR